MSLNDIIKKLIAGMIFVSVTSYSSPVNDIKQSYEEIYFDDLFESKAHYDNFMEFHNLFKPCFATDSYLITDLILPKIAFCKILYQNNKLEVKLKSTEDDVDYYFKIDNSNKYYNVPNLDDIDDNLIMHKLFIIPIDKAGNKGSEEMYIFIDKKYGFKKYLKWLNHLNSLVLCILNFFDVTFILIIWFL